MGSRAIRLVLLTLLAVWPGVDSDSSGLSTSLTWSSRFKLGQTIDFPKMTAINIDSTRHTSNSDSDSTPWDLRLLLNKGRNHGNNVNVSNFPGTGTAAIDGSSASRTLDLDLTKSQESAQTPRSPQTDYPIVINLRKEVSNLTHFWKSTGFCPPDPHQKAGEWFLGKDMTMNLAYIGALPNGGIEQVRIHWLLNAITVSHFKKGQPVYNFTQLDQLIENLWSNGLKPGFEIMGNPSDYFRDMENKTQVHQWKDLVYQMAKRYIDQYGVGYVASWNFESWNEPREDRFDALKMTRRGFLNYYDACSEGLKLASPLLKLGGPGGACDDSFDLTCYCWALLDHCAKGRNFFTGEKGTRIDYISIHRKGEEPNNTAVLFKKESKFVNLLKKHLSELVHVPLYNDEADPLVSWNVDKWWRADVTYAATVAKVIVQHQVKWIQGASATPNFKLLSNDNGFLSYNPYFFTERTLLARFQINSTQPRSVQFIRKPGYSIMALLSFLGERQVRVYIEGERPNGYPDFGALGSLHYSNGENGQEGWQLGVMMYYSADTNNVTATAQVKPQLILPTNMSVTNVRYVLYKMDNQHSNPYAIWVKAGKPKEPDFATFRDMRENEEPVRVKGPAPFNQSDIQPWTISLPGVLLLHLCDKSPMPPDQVTGVTAYGVTVNQVLIVWSDSCVNTKCIKTYEVEFSSKSASGPYVRINVKDTIFNSFHYAPSSGTVHGYYRIRAVDYWDRPGEYSLVLQYLVGMEE